MEIRKLLTSTDVERRIGLNYSIILFSAILIESELEANLRILLQDFAYHFDNVSLNNSPKYKVLQKIFKRYEEIINLRISKTTGPFEFDELLKLLYSKEKGRCLQDYPKWEAVSTLSKLRNVLAHGRQFESEQIISPKMRDSDINTGSYKQVLAYLLKKKICKKSKRNNLNIHEVLADTTADHFYTIAQDFIQYASELFAKAAA